MFLNLKSPPGPISVSTIGQFGSEVVVVVAGVVVVVEIALQPLNPLIAPVTGASISVVISFK